LWAVLKAAVATLSVKAVVRIALIVIEMRHLVVLKER